MGRKKYSNELKARIALDAIKVQKTIAELAPEYEVPANQISLWKKQLLDETVYWRYSVEIRLTRCGSQSIL
jgi:transposase-like protein